MIEQVNHLLTRISFFHLNVLLLLGLALFGGTIGGRLFQKLKIPQVVGYMIIGLLAGQSVFNLINEDVLRALQPFNYFALGLIAFSIGGELRRDFFQRYGKQVSVTLFTEAMIAFILVTAAVGFAGTFLMHDASKAWALGLLLGAIAAATDAASTMHVFTEFKTRGPLTKTTLGIVALDDGLAFILFAIISSTVTQWLGIHSEGIITASVRLIYEIGGSVLIGGISAFILTKLLDHYTEEERIITFSIGVVLFVLGLSLACGMDMLISAMTLGAIITNVNPRRSKQLFEIMGRFTPPIYVLFFVLIGAAINVHAVSFLLVAFVVLYIFARTVGKTIGARIGTKITHAPVTVHKNLPYCLFSQASAAIGLAILGLQRFPGEIGTIIMMTITLTTMVLQLIGPSFVRIAVRNAQEEGLNITEDDVVRSLKVKDVMDTEPPIIQDNLQLVDILKIFSGNNNLSYPVVNAAGKLVGVITVDSIRQTFMETDLAHFLLSHDLMEQVAASVVPEDSVQDARDLLDRYNVDYLPVVSPDEGVAGFIERRRLKKIISTRILELEQKVISLG